VIRRYNDCGKQGSGSGRDAAAELAPLVGRRELVASRGGRTTRVKYKTLTNLLLAPFAASQRLFFGRLHRELQAANRKRVFVHTPPRPEVPCRGPVCLCF
jgi:hypothetical protein